MPIRVILDFPDRHGSETRRIFRTPQRVVSTDRHDRVAASLTAIEQDCEAGATAIGFVSYEAAPAFDAAFSTQASGTVPLLWFALFEQQHTAPFTTGEPAEPSAWRIDTPRAEHAQAVAFIHEEIAAGTTYQVNYTARLTRRHAGDPLAWYEGLRRAAGPGYHAYIETDGWCVLSVSPELFFETDGLRIRTRPMKGTRPRGRFAEEDAELADELRASPKERAENLMIVDLMRNDLGRVAQTGSVQVTSLYDVEKYPTVLQLTSTIEANLRPDGSLAQILAALFPPGSVTGAPKISTMRLIAELERSPRGVYCGAIGVVERGRRVFNVPIRTIWLDRTSGLAEFGTGGGITADSRAGAEYDELLTKARVVSQTWPEFELLETMRLENSTLVRQAQHLLRLEESAEYFGFHFCERSVQRALAGARSESQGRTARLRLLLARDGDVRFELLPLDELPAEPRVALARTGVDSSSPFLFHKTTNRVIYDVHHPAGTTLFDILLYNERGELTEFTRGNLVIELGGRCYTPPRACGLLAGVFRADLLRRGAVEERVLHKNEIAHVERIWFVNSVREWVEVTLV